MKTMWQRKSGFTDWIHPSKKFFKMGCCDCGLVHDIQFRIDDANQLNFRARRNEKATKKLRKKTV